MSDARKTVAEMAADILREAALLLGVFGWLDKAVHNEPFFGPWGWQVLGIASACLVTGVVLERVRGRT